MERIESLMEKDGTQTQNQKDTLARAHQYFKELLSKDEKRSESQIPKDPTAKVDRNNDLVDYIGRNDVRRAIKSLKKGKAAGPDKIGN